MNKRYRKDCEQRLLNLPESFCSLSSRTPRQVRRAGYVALVLLLAATAVCNAQEVQPTSAQPQQLEPCGLFSDFRVTPLLVPQPERTAVRIMSSRYRDLWQAQDGYERTGIDLVAYDGTTFAPAGFSDDSGMYYYVLLISRIFHLSLPRSISMFLVSALFLSAVIGLLGLQTALQTWQCKILVFVVLGGLTLLAYRLGDVYLFEFAVPITVIPWVWWEVRRRAQTWRTSLLLLVVGCVIGWGTTVRTVAGIPAFVVVLVLVATQFKAGNKRKLVMTCLVVAGALFPILLLHQLEAKRNTFLLSRTAIQPENLSRHMFWHLAYTGLGFVSNPYVPGGVCDEGGKAKVWAIAPDAPYLSRKYNDVLRREVIMIASEHLSLVFFTIAAKLGIVVAIVAIFGSVGLVTALLQPVDKRIGLIFLPALLASGLPILLVAPSPQYLMGLITLAAIYDVFCFDEAFQSALTRATGVVGLEHAKYLNLWSSAKSGTSA